MSLRARTALIIALTTAALVGALHVVLGAALLRSFKELEKHRMTEACHRAAGAIGNELRQLDLKLSDWAAWDDPYEYVVAPTEEFERENLLPSALQSLQLESIAIFDQSGALVQGVRLDESRASTRGLTDEELSAIRPAAARVDHDAPGTGVTGLATIDDRLLLVAARPIVRSDLSGPSRGTIVFSRALGPDLVAQLERMMRIRLAVAVARRPDRPGVDPRTILGDPHPSDDSVEVEPLSASVVRARTTLAALTEDAGAEVVVESERLIYARGQAAIRWLVGALLTAGAVFGVVMMFVMGRAVVRPVRRLGEEVRRIGAANHADAHVTVRGNDEIAGLARRVNEMLTALGSARRAAEAASRAKGDFLANMSHEIRTPVAAMLGYADLLAEPDMPADQRPELAHTIRRNGEHLLAIINDILDLAKIEAGQLAIRPVECDPLSVTRDVLESLTPRARAAGLALALEAVGPIPTLVRTDPLRLHQVLLNLVGNAVKFTRDGGVRVVVKLASPAESPRPILRFEVVDTGPGMSPALTEKLFQPFTQGDESASRRFGGTGLGLTISRRLARAMGGDLDLLWTEPGRGSAFVATILAEPVAGAELVEPGRAQAREPQRRAAPALTRLAGRILVADDGIDNRRLLSHMLSRAGAEVVCVEDGRQAVDAALASRAQGRPFDLVLMDMQMPQLDGYAATLELRAKGWTGPVVALTAHAMSGDRENCLASGCDDYATKPISAPALTALCDRWMRPSGSAAAA